MKEQSKVYNRFEIIPDPQWEKLVERITYLRGTVLILGTTNSGKSTLTRYLIENIIKRNYTVALVDSDIGQSSLGIPGTINMKVFRENKDLLIFKPEKTFFIGFLNPAKNIPFMIEGTKKLVDYARRKTEIVIVDTTGLVQGSTGEELKMGKIKSIIPEHIVAIQRGDELENLLTLTNYTDIHRLKVSQLVKERNKDIRMKYRKERYNEYFNKKKVQEFILDNVDFFYNGKPLTTIKTSFVEGTLIGLNYKNDTIALGILLEFDRKSITFKSPIQSIKNINRVVLSDINIYI